MAKIVVLGDIHGRTCWYDIIEKENPDLTIFLGDYVSTHDRNITAEQQCSNLEDILNYKEANPDKVILLRGNHDMQHLGYSWAKCSGYFSSVANWMVSIKDRFLNLTQWIYIHDDIIFSHAGLSKTWCKSIGFDDYSDINSLYRINDINPSEVFGFTPERLSDWSGDSKTQPLTWIRPYSLITDALDDYIQVVGHTKLNTPGNVFELDEPYWSGLSNKEYREKNNINAKELWFIDCLPEQYMVIEDNKREMRNWQK